ncbi:MAG TPA: molecular chaperone DnaJ, partial [bacterium]|nr:molecular chaperone DnaJ [bacterium]
MRDFYAVLGVDRNASQDQIKQAFRRLARENHPDVKKDDPQADDRFKEINEAYQVLGDPDRRAQYDRFGTVQPFGTDMREGGFGPFEDIFDMFFGRRGRVDREAPEPGADLRCDLELTLEEAATGFEKTIEIERLETCPSCFGTGAERGSSPETCSTCRGAGEVRYSQRTVFGSFTQIGTCNTCGGTGKVIRNPCRKCGGSGRAATQRTLSVKVPAGVDNGMRLRMAGEGEAGARGGERGDLYVFIHVRPHPVFERRGRDLHSTIPISIAQATLGDEVQVPTLDGPVAQVVPAGVQPGTVLTVKGKGMPDPRGGR